MIATKPEDTDRAKAPERGEWVVESGYSVCGVVR